MTLHAALLAVVLSQAPAAPAPPAIDETAALRLLETGKITQVKTLSKGVTKPRRVTLTDGTTTHDAVFQNVDEEKGIERFASGKVEIGFRDSYHFNIAASGLARAIGLDGLVPPCIERVVQNDRGSLCWWVTWKWDEQMRVKEKRQPPSPLAWQRQLDTSRVFTALVDDTDRNQTNLLITEDWKLWSVDFSRAFRTSKELREREKLFRCPRALLERLRALDDAAIRAAVGTHLRPAEIEAVAVRRRLLVEHFDALVKEKGELVVLF
jgi:hypothetical protein